MSIKITKKNLKELGKSLGGYYCGGNVYTHENIREYLGELNYKRILDAAPNNENVVELANVIKEVTEFGTRDKKIYSTLIAYSVGYYGNSGQIFKYDLYISDFLSSTFYTYYC